MDKYDELLREYEDRVSIEEHSMVHEGLYCDDVIWINKALTEQRKACILAEELGHYETSVGDILDTNELKNAKQEHAGTPVGNAEADSSGRYQGCLQPRIHCSVPHGGISGC